MDIRNRKQGWSSTELIEYERYLEKKNLLHSCDPTILVKNPDTDEYEPWGIKDYKYVDPSFFLRDNTPAWCTDMSGRLELPFPGGKKITIENVSAVIITWGKNHISWGLDQSTTLHRGLCGIAPDLEEIRLHGTCNKGV